MTFLPRNNVTFELKKCLKRAKSRVFVIFQKVLEKITNFCLKISQKYYFTSFCFWHEFTVGGSNLTFMPINVRVLWVSSKQLKTTNVFFFFDKLIVVDVLIGTLARIYDRNSRYHSVAWKTNLLKPNYVWIMWDVWWYWFQASTGIRSAVVPRNLSRGNLENGSSL